MDDISHMVKLPIEKCVELFQSYFDAAIPPSLFIVGNNSARADLRKCVENATPCFVIGGNGVGKSSSIREVAKFLDYSIQRIYPLSQEEIVKEFGKAPFSAEKTMFVIEADGLGAKKYSILNEYIKNTKAPLIFTASLKKALNSNVVKKLKVLEFNPPTKKAVELFLKKKYSWNGNIDDVYDSDMRVVLNRVLSDEDIYKPEEPVVIGAMDLAQELSYGYVKKEIFDTLNQPLWWVMRSLAFNQRVKFPTGKKGVANLDKLSYLDTIKFGEPLYLKSMLMKLTPSPRRGFFKFAVWPKKTAEEEGYNTIKKSQVPMFVPKPVEVKKAYTLGNWM